MTHGERGTAVTTALWFLLIIAVGGGLFGYSAYQFTRQNQLLDELKQDIHRESQERKGLEDQVQRIEQLYNLIGKDLAGKDKKFSEVLSTALDSKGEEIQENKQLLEETRNSMDRIAAALEDESSKRGSAADQLKHEIEGCQQRLAQSTAMLNTIAGRIETIKSQIEEELKSHSKDSETFQTAVLGRVASQSSSISDLQSKVSGDLNWLRGEVQRLDRRIDDLNHEMRRVESRRPD